MIMYTEKDYELARDIAREQFTDDPDDPHWWEDEDDEDDPDRVVYVDPNGVEVTQRELDALDQLAAGYCARNNINIFN